MLHMMSMRKLTIVFSTFFFTITQCVAQIYIEPVVGYQADLNNHFRFTQINTGCQGAFVCGKNYELVVRVQKSWGFAYRAMDSSFTANPSLPLYAAAKKTITPATWFFSVDHRLKLKSHNTNHRFSVLLLTGFMDQKLTVNYKYDEEHYTILNPDVSQKKFSLFLGIGMEYMRFIGKNRLFVQLTASGPLVGDITYPSSFSYMAPLSCNVGYSIFIQKKKHEK